MADAVYTKALEAMIDGNIDLKDGTVKLVLLTAAYTANMSTDEFLDDIPAGARVATATIATPTITGGVFDAPDVTFPSVPAGSTVTQMAIYIDGSPENSARLFARIDSYPGLPFDTSGSDVTVAFPGDSAKICVVENA